MQSAKECRAIVSLGKEVFGPCSTRAQSGPLPVWVPVSKSVLEEGLNYDGPVFMYPVALPLKEGAQIVATATLDWSQCPAVESIPGKRSGAWVFRDTRTPVSVVFDNLEVGASINEIMEWFHLSHEQVVAVIEFAARSLDAPPVLQQPVHGLDAHTL